MECDDAVAVLQGELIGLKQTIDNLYKDNETLKIANDKLIRELELLQSKYDYLESNNAFSREARSKIQQLHYDNYKVVRRNSTRRISEIDPSQHVHTNVVQQVSIPEQSYSNQNTSRRTIRAPSVDQFKRLNQRENVSIQDERRRQLYGTRPKFDYLEKLSAQDHEALNKKIFNRCRTITQHVYY